MIDKAEEITKELLEKMGIVAKVEVSMQNDVLNISIDSKDSGLLIGYHGDTLYSLQLILGIMINLGKDKWQRVLVDIGEYRKQREEVLRRMVERAVREAKDAGEAQELPPMPAFERRRVHLLASEKEGVVTESRGEGRERRVLIKVM